MIILIYLHVAFPESDNEPIILALPVQASYFWVQLPRINKHPITSIRNIEEPIRRWAVQNHIDFI